MEDCSSLRLHTYVLDGVDVGALELRGLADFGRGDADLYTRSHIHTHINASLYDPLAAQQTPIHPVMHAGEMPMHTHTHSRAVPLTHARFLYA